MVRTRENEYICVIADQEALNIFIGVSFTDKVDNILAKLMITEMIEARRHVKNAPAFGFTPENEQIPKLL